MANERYEELIEVIKVSIYRDLRQRFEFEEVSELYRKIDAAVEKCGFAQGD